MLQDTSVIGHLTTVGRVTGRPHRVPLRLVRHQGRLYASQRDTASDWCLNLIKNPRVTVELAGEQIHGTARIPDDQELARKISNLKYPDDRARRVRVIVEIVPDAHLSTGSG